MTNLEPIHLGTVFNTQTSFPVVVISTPLWKPSHLTIRELPLVRHLDIRATSVTAPRTLLVTDQKYYKPGPFLLADETQVRK